MDSVPCSTEWWSKISKEKKHQPSYLCDVETTVLHSESYWLQFYDLVLNNVILIGLLCLKKIPRTLIYCYTTVLVAQDCWQCLHSSMCLARAGGCWVPAEKVPGKDKTCFSGTERRGTLGREEQLPVKDKVPGAAFSILYCLGRALPDIPSTHCRPSGTIFQKTSRTVWHNLEDLDCTGCQQPVRKQNIWCKSSHFLWLNSHSKQGYLCLYESALIFPW